MDLTKCPLCFLDVEANNFVRHVCKYHKSAPNFRVQCNEEGCFATYTNWFSYKKHVTRNHGVRLEVEEDPQAPPGIIEENVNNDVMEEGAEADPDIRVAPSPENAANHLQGEDLLKWHASVSVVELKERHSLPQAAVSKVVDIVEDLTQETFKTVKDMILAEANEETGSVSVEAIAGVFSKFKNFSLFEVSNAKKMNSFLRNNGMVDPVKVVLGRRRVWGSQGRLRWVQDVAYMVPFLKNLEFFLNNRDVLYCVDNPKIFDGVYRSVMDGSYYRSHPVYLRDNKALAVIFYYDDIEVTNPLGAKTTKLAMFYSTLGNIYPEYRSTLKVINLVGICTTENLKRYGAAVVLQSFISDMQKLGSEEGVMLKISGGERKFTGLLHFAAGDTPASGSLSGFKESVGAAVMPCRTCRTDNEMMRSEFDEENFTMRDTDTHNIDLAEILSPDLTRRQKIFLSKVFGVNSKSAFLEIPDTDVTQIFPHDIMHVVFEGVVCVEVTEFLKYCISNQFFTLKSFNDALKSFDYGHISADKPVIIESVHLDNGVHQGAANMKALLYVIPFLIAQWIQDDDDEHLQNYLRLVQIANLVMAYEFEIAHVHLLRRMILTYLTNFKTLYPDKNITPKMHFLTHLPGQIVKFGPLRQQSCFRFEGAHAYYKSLIRKLRNFINVPLTLSTRRQARMAADLLCPIPGVHLRGFLFNNDTVSAGDRIELTTYEFKDELIALLNLVDVDFVFSANSITVKGSTFKKGRSVILLNSDFGNLPLFAQITEIIVRGNDKVFVYDELTTCEFSYRLNAYNVQRTIPRESGMLRVQDLTFCHALSIFKCMSDDYVILFDSNRSEFDG